MRVLMMEINQESNTFCAVHSTLEDFKRCCFYEGAALLKAVRGRQVALGGMIQAMEEAGVEIIPGFAMRATAGGVVEASAVDYFMERLRAYAEKAGRIDGCFISFHGATQSTASEDVCGDVLEEARALFGGDVVIATSYDLHANITPRMLQYADIVCGYQTYPHIDHFNTGYRAAALGIRMMRGEALHMAYGFVPMIQPASGYTTAEGALKGVMDSLFAQVNSGKLIDFTAFQMQPWLDVACGNSSIVAISDDRTQAEDAVARALRDMWAIRHEMSTHVVGVDEVIAAARCHEDGHPVVVSDFADSPNAGAAGDNFDIAAALMEKAPQLRVAAILNDVPLVKRAFDAGVGATFEASIGGTRESACSRAYKAAVTVHSLHSGEFTIEGPAMRGVVDNIGPTATLRVGNVDLVACTGMATTGDPQLLRHFGVEPTLHDVVIVKACTSFRAPYGPFAGTILAMDTGCAATADLTHLPFTRLPRDMFPFRDEDAPAALTRVFCK